MGGGGEYAEGDGFEVTRAKREQSNLDHLRHCCFPGQILDELAETGK
jgi:hypothetical protein